MMLKVELEDEVKRLKGEVKALEDEIVRLKGAHQAFKEKIRDRMILEADRRNWCSEFDSIISEFGIRGRFQTRHVYVNVSRVGSKYVLRGKPSNWVYVDENTFRVGVLSKDDEHAKALVNNHVCQYISTSHYEIVKVEEAI